MAAMSDEKPSDLRSSDPEKVLDSKDPLAAAGFEDPDAGLSDEEKAEIVRVPSHPRPWSHGGSQHHLGAEDLIQT